MVVVGTMGILAQTLPRKCFESGHAIWFDLELVDLATALYPSPQYRGDTPSLAPARISHSLGRSPRDTASCNRRFQPTKTRCLPNIGSWTPIISPTWNMRIIRSCLLCNVPTQPSPSRIFPNSGLICCDISPNRRLRACPRDQGVCMLGYVSLVCGFPNQWVWRH